jgi:hypothetical protein
MLPVQSELTTEPSVAGCEKADQALDIRRLLVLLSQDFASLGETQF